ncbi:MAG: DUF3160 domain-containing protein [Candidatus Altiarchaeales archaeon]|nr:DUF3160 domain-containing protein [Candidatus Altiarchaeales archaeon]MBD3416718.1 DUF3160 domain-containing protein [Candidatus Altiarchaeales archaeon]
MGALDAVAGGYDYCKSNCSDDEMCYSSRQCSPTPEGVDCGPQTGDLRCHRRCRADFECLSGQECREVDIFQGDVKETVKLCFGGVFRPSDFDEDLLWSLREELAGYPSPKIYGGTGLCEVSPGSREDVLECLESTKGFRLMGQRFIPDSYMFQNLVGAGRAGFYTGGAPTPFTYGFTDGGSTRVFPRGLDVMALLGSARAAELLDELNDTMYTRYDESYQNLSAEFNSFTEEDWNRNLYWSWLYSLKPLLKEYGSGYPTFMQSDEWEEKELNTALASWTELRHDTILYAKQSYTMKLTGMPVEPEEKPVVGYVEPVPEFYARLLSLTRMTNSGLDEMGVLGEASKRRLTKLDTILSRLVDISDRELENRELSDEDYEFIKDFGDELNAVISEVDDKAKKTTLVADVHTDTNSMMVLEEGVGYVDLVIVAYKVPDGRVILGAGPVFTYYEFKHPMADRLTDEKWRQMLQDNPPVKPEWMHDE